MGAVLATVNDPEPCGHCSVLEPICKQLREPNTSVPHPTCKNSQEEGAPATARVTSTTAAAAAVQAAARARNARQCPGYDTGYTCVAPRCDDVAPFCALGSAVGLRARQICPQTCGCDQPRSSLALSLPESGCPRSCELSTRYRDALHDMPCEDVANNDTNWLGFLEQWRAESEIWPFDWKQSANIYIDLFRRFGCGYLDLNGVPHGYKMPESQPIFWPANQGAGVNPCIARGTYYPVKPISYFCPVRCGCRAGDAHCPDTCPSRNAPANELGQVGGAGLNPNPSPLNVYNFPWRYSNEKETVSNCTLRDPYGPTHCPEEDH